MLDAAGEQLGEREFEHSGEGLSQIANWLLSFAAGDAGEVGVAIETPSGPVVESLLEHGFAVHSTNPKQLDCFRDRQGKPWGCAPAVLPRHRRGGTRGLSTSRACR